MPVPVAAGGGFTDGMAPPVPPVPVPVDDVPEVFPSPGLPEPVDDDEVSIDAVVVAVLPLVLTSILCEALMVAFGMGVKVATLPVIARMPGVASSAPYSPRRRILFSTI